MLRYGLFLILVPLATDFGLTFGLVPLTEFFPYGPSAGDNTLPPTDGATFSAALQTPFNFLGFAYNSITGEENGVLSFGPHYPFQFYGEYPCDGTQGKPTVPLIAPFWINSATYANGSVYYREETKDAVSLCRVAKDALTHFKLRLKPKSLFIATWVEVPPIYNQPGNTFQAVLASDGTNSLVYFLYNKLQSGQDYVFHYPASVGFAPGDGLNYYQVGPYSCTADILQVGDESNVDHPGQYIFKVDATVEGPLTRRKFRTPLSKRPRNATMKN